MEHKPHSHSTGPAFPSAGLSLAPILSHIIYHSEGEPFNPAKSLDQGAPGWGVQAPTALLDCSPLPTRTPQLGTAAARARLMGQHLSHHPWPQ